MRNDQNKQLDKLLVEQSSEWLEAMKHEGEDERRGLVNWLLQSKRHVRTHLLMTALEEELKRIDPERRILIPDVRVRQSSNVAALNPSPERMPARRVRPWLWAAAATVLITATAALLYIAMIGRSGWQEFTTVVGEQRAMTLEDGSIVQLNTASRVKVRVSGEAREIRLLNGEALFKVAHDRARPFNVYTSDATIVAVGTQFNVYRVAGRTKVSVLEGRVRVSASDEPPISRGASPSTMTSTPAAPVLDAGEEAEIDQGRIDRRKTPDVADTAAWIQRRVVFKQEPLANVVMEFNRYRKSPQFRVENSALAARKYSGIFDVDDPRSLEDVLAHERDVVLDRSGDDIVIKRRVESATATAPQ